MLEVESKLRCLLPEQVLLTKGFVMGDWDFLHGLEGQELQDAMSSGATSEEWAFVEAQDALDEEE